VKKAFEYQRDGVCFSLIEILSICPTNWGLSPGESVTWLEEAMIPYYPLGIVKEPAQKKQAKPAPSESVPSAT
jgi:2-oxoglutarate ferredoxin oxidoreductase subunit beta